MISLLSRLSPSSLLYCGDLTPGAEMLSKECLTSREGWLGRIEQLARDAEELQQRKGDRIGCAVALLRLGDQCRETGRLGLAQKYCEQARELFRQHSFKSEQCHNEAVATYALGLVNQLLGNVQEALDLYEQALTLFERAKRHWRAVGNRRRDRQCERTLLWINRLRNYVADIRSQGMTTTLPYSALICPWPSDIKQADCPPAELEVQEYVPTLEARIEGKDFMLHPTSGATLVLKCREEYYVAKAPDGGIPGLNVQKGDYLLIHRAKEVRKAGAVTVTEEEETSFKFERRADGTIHFISSDARIIGSRGIIVGIFKPT